MTSDDFYDIAIVGMGPAGLYAGWRLATAAGTRTILGKSPDSLRVALFDAQPEALVGGRLCTQPLPGYPFLAELGGMRYRDSQLLIKGLIGALGLEKQVLPFSFPQDFYYLRGERFSEEELRLQNTYKVLLTEKNKLPAELIADAIYQILRDLRFGQAFHRSAADLNPRLLIRKLRRPNGVHNLTSREWAVIKCLAEYRGANFLFDVGFWDLLQFHLSSEGWHLAHDGLGYESIMGNWNAAIALPWFLADFGSDKAWTLADGMSAIPLRMYDILRRTPKYACHLNHSLIGVDANNEAVGPLIQLDFATSGGGRHSVRAGAVILALPKGALIRLKYGDGLLRRAAVPRAYPSQRSWFMDQLNSVVSKPLFKLFLGYKEPWWHTSCGRASTGKVNTDLPLRQVYYYGSELWHKGRAEDLRLRDGRDHHSMLMASYSDSHYIEFWSELERGNTEEQLTLHRYCPAKNTLSPRDLSALERFGAPKSMVLRAEHQLGLLHGYKDLQGAETPRADVGLYMEWSRAPYYAGWHAWKVGAEPWRVSTALTRPFRGPELYICGEAYSDEQGWTEGALKSTERLMSEVFDLPLPHLMLEQEFGGNEEKLLRYIKGWVEPVW